MGKGRVLTEKQEVEGRGPFWLSGAVFSERMLKERRKLSDTKQSFTPAPRKRPLTATKKCIELRGEYVE